MWAVPLVIGCGPSELHQEVTRSLCLAHSPTRYCATRLCKLRGREGGREGGGSKGGSEGEREGKREGG